MILDVIRLVMPDVSKLAMLNVIIIMWLAMLDVINLAMWDIILGFTASITSNSRQTEQSSMLFSLKSAQKPTICIQIYDALPIATQPGQSPVGKLPLAT